MINPEWPWKVGDLIVYHYDITKPFTENLGKNGVIIEIPPNSMVGQVTILVEGKVMTVLPSHLSTPKVKKIKSSFGLKR